MSMMLALRPTLILTGLLTLGACAPVSRVILLPQADSPASQVTVTTPKAQLLVDQPYGVAEISRDGRLTPATTTAEDVAKTYPNLLALQPQPPERFTLQFEPGTSQLTAESKALLATVIERARTRPGGELIVTGHTDRQGAADANDRLSLERANAIRDLLIEGGFQSDLVEAVGRGEREPVVPTEDDVVEPRNRRAEIVVR